MAANIITHEELKELLHYDLETGVFTWKVNRTGRTKAGTIAGCVDTNGYIRIQVYNTRYLAHRLAWLYTYGVWPTNQIDHINGLPNNNRIANLREATNAENRQNKGKHNNNTSGYTGVSWHKRAKKWQATIGVNGVNKHLGLFSTPELAYEAYLKAKAKLHAFQPTPR